MLYSKRVYVKSVENKETAECTLPDEPVFNDSSWSRRNSPHRKFVDDNVDWFVVWSLCLQ